MRFNLGKTKTYDVGEMATVLPFGRAAVVLTEWQTAVSKNSGTVVHRISRWGHFYDNSISTRSVNAVLKMRLANSALIQLTSQPMGCAQMIITSA